MDMENTQSEINSGAVYDGYSYETQFFGFTPRSLVDGVYEALVSYGTERLKVLETQLIDKKMVPVDVAPEQVSKVVNSILEQYNNRIKNIYDRFEEYILKNLLYIPPHVLLPEDQVQQNQYTKKDEEEVDLEIEELKRNIFAEEAMKGALEDEHRQLNMYSTELLKHKTHLEELSQLLELNGDFQDQLKDTITKSVDLHSQIGKSLNARIFPVKDTGSRSIGDNPDLF